MYLLYADESGTPGGDDQVHFILAGVTVFERKTHWLSLELDEIAAQFNGYASGPVELHGSPMAGGRGMWYHVPRDDRINAIKNALSLIDGHRVRIIASVVNKQKITPDDPVHHTFLQLISRFDDFLRRKHLHEKDTQRGIVIFDKSAKETAIQKSATVFKTDGHKAGKLRKLHNMAEVPVFIDSTASRLVQLADLVAYALFRKYESNDERFYEIIKDKFDSFGGIRHGLHESI